MCELFCFSSAKKRELNEYLNAFYSHCDLHPHGWGLTNMDKFIKEPIKASYSTRLKEILSKPVKEKTLFAHIRLATVGNITYENSHPFTRIDDAGRKWTLMHNGTIFDFDELKKYDSLIEGDTDSEKLLFYIVDEVNRKNPCTIKERIEIIESIIFRLSKGNKLNLMLFDGEIMYVHSNFKDSMHYLKKDDGVLISTKPLSEDDGWKDLDLHKLYCIKDGEVIYKSESHENLFEFNESNLNYFINMTKLYFSTLYLKEIPTSYILKSDFGIEWESLRVTGDGHLALTPHPEIFGDKSSNPIVTTDFSESQLEIITQTYPSLEEAYNQFMLLSNLVNANLDDGEYMWFNSMPPILPCDDEIPVAEYKLDRKSQEYRINLAKKYGFKKQMISGVHFNFSFGDEFMEKLFEMVDNKTFREFKDELYLKISRNYLRYCWLIIYLTGCSTACHETFTDYVKNLCDDVDGHGSYMTSKGTSLRNSSGGYKNIDELYPSYQNIDEFVEDIEKFIEWGKLSEAKELYTQIRLKPKNPANLLESLKNDGIQYVEIRTLDLNPYNYGLIKDDMEFLQIFLIYMLSKEEINYPNWQSEAKMNEILAAEAILNDECELYCNGYKVPFKTYALDLINDIYKMCDELNLDTSVVDLMYRKIINPDLTYARLLNDIIKEEGFINFNLKIAKDNKEISKKIDYSEIEDKISTVLPNK